MTRKILHAADIHLDSPLRQLSQFEDAPVDDIRGASRKALQNLVKLAIDCKVDLVVIAGDLYDGDWNDYHTGMAFVKAANQLVAAGIPMLVICGNHDAQSKMTSSLTLPKNPDDSEIFLRTKKPETRVLESIGVAVHGQSFHLQHETQNMAIEYPDPIPDLFNIGLLHTGLEGDSGHAHYAPCTRNQLIEKGYDYWALGHIHQRQDHGTADGPPIVYPGNLQGRHIGEPGAKGCVIIEVDDRNRCDYQFHALDVLRWFLIELDVSGCASVPEMKPLLGEQLRSLLVENPESLLAVRIELTGQTELHESLRRSVAHVRAEMQSTCLIEGQERVWLEKVKVKTSRPKQATGRSDFSGPLLSLQHVADSWRQDDTLMQILQKELAAIEGKLPKELAATSDDPAFRFSDSQWCEEILSDAISELQFLLLGGSQPGGQA